MKKNWNILKKNRQKPITFFNWLHRFVLLLCGTTFLLIFAGGLVTGHHAGLSVPDWPTSYGHFMFAFPLAKMVGGILYEHGHRLIASVVGLMTVVVAIWLMMKEPRRGVRWLGITALALVISQGILGGLAVHYLLPPAISIVHACLAQAFFCATILLAMVTSPKWSQRAPTIQSNNGRVMRFLALLLTLAVFVQLMLGATIRHVDIGIIPHVLLAVGIVLCTGYIFSIIYSELNLPEFRITVNSLALLIIAQLGLGIATYLVRVPKLAAIQPSTVQVIVPAIHLALGALILATSFVLTVKCFRVLAVAPEDYTLPVTEVVRS